MNDLHFDIYIAAKPDAVWKALTGREGVAALYFGSRLETTFAPGSTYGYVGPDGKGGETVHVEGEIVACQPGQLLKITHRAGPMWRTGPKVFTSGLAYTLEDLGFATKLSLHHDQFVDGDPGYEHNATGWMVFLSSVKSYVETGKPLAVLVG